MTIRASWLTPEVLEEIRKMNLTTTRDNIRCEHWAISPMSKAILRLFVVWSRRQHDLKSYVGPYPTFSDHEVEEVLAHTLRHKRVILNSRVVRMFDVNEPIATSGIKQLSRHVYSLCHVYSGPQLDYSKKGATYHRLRLPAPKMLQMIVGKVVLYRFIDWCQGIRDSVVKTKFRPPSQLTKLRKLRSLQRLTELQ